MRLTNYAELPACLRGAVIAIGNFDGIHKGHKKVLQTALRQAQKTGKPAAVFTFEPHPRSFFNPRDPVYRLTNAAQKADFFKNMGFDAVIEQAFTAEFAALTAEDFIRVILCDSIAASGIIAGENFHFGSKRQGTPAFLRETGQKYGLTVLLTAGLKDNTGKLISSGRIRALLENGKIAQANRLLGHIYAVRGKIIHGQALGRQFGFPTANMALPAETKLHFGIYAVYFHLSGAIYRGAASFGRRPTVESAGAPLLETFIFDFDQNIYGKEAEVLFVNFLRGEKKFADTESLIAQMRKDAAQAKKLLTANPSFLASKTAEKE